MKGTTLVSAARGLSPGEEMYFTAWLTGPLQHLSGGAPGVGGGVCVISPLRCEMAGGS